MKKKSLSLSSYARFILVLCLCPLIGWPSFAQLTSSNLPIVIITPESTILDDARTVATMKIIYRGAGQMNYLDDLDNPDYLDYDGLIDIEIRGSSTQFTPKKQYGFTTLLGDKTTKNNVSLLGMPKENDWILNGMTFDPALIRDYLCYNLSRKTGEYASRTMYCEVIIDGDYTGLYILQEKIKADDNRVSVVKIEPTDIVLPDVSGGYITKADKTTGGDPVAWTLYSRTNGTVDYIHDWPKPSAVNQFQNSYIKSVFLNLTAKAFDKNVSVTDGVPSLIDIPSFIHFMIISELSSNVDAYMFSTYFHKDRNGKLRAGPVWDCDLTFGNDLFFWGLDRSKTDIWQFSNYDNEGSRFWYDLYNTSLFRCYLSKRWNELTRPGQPLNITSLESFIDQTVSIIGDAVARDRARWGTTGTYQHEIDDIKFFLQNRIPWITDNLGSFQQCTNVLVPPLVIDKIMYHPDTSFEFPHSDAQEFVEIFNNSNDIVDLSGIYFRGTGFVYQFPAHATIDRYASLVIAANASVFESKYGCTPYDEFTRHLSNKGQSLILADGFGNIIDSVRYSDTIPWPAADGNGLYLKLNDPAMDNGVATSWSASDDVIVSNRNASADPEIIIYPNPVTDVLYFRSESLIETFSITDMQGRTLITEVANSEWHEVDMQKLQAGTYIIRLVSRDHVVSRKVVKR